LVFDLSKQVTCLNSSEPDDRSTKVGIDANDFVYWKRLKFTHKVFDSFPPGWTPVRESIPIAPESTRVKPE
jgi:hypothetical protein